MRARLLNMDADDSMYSEYEEDDRFENFMKEVKFSGKQQKNENFNFLEEKTQESFIKLFHKKVRIFFDLCRKLQHRIALK